LGGVVYRAERVQSTSSTWWRFRYAVQHVDDCGPPPPTAASLGQGRHQWWTRPAYTFRPFCPIQQRRWTKFFLGKKRGTKFFLGKRSSEFADGGGYDQAEPVVADKRVKYFLG